ncbi:type IX secretion system membrane protein PorP/SprF [Flavobacteriaceae bacterium F89]|uniref:Type IX secretion system membrane protein PorP/SprF n=1 Tax=Cerina litoralis TaxID=2874477 RepID=A0AAE3JRM2_9FLAO|nr:type IX secretion system membrane protein PorP/SprF [Cerina litoralis]MCG2459782.1 type IX secretion system membrane protein PorP/SprF [Cerina litoralis]
MVYKSNRYRNGLLFVLMVCSAIALHGQKEPQYTQYMYNIGSFNPAYVGTVETPEIASLYRAQWISVPGAPRTIRLGANVPFSNEKNGMGFNVINDQLGPVSQTYLDAAYSFQIKLSEATKLSFGVNAGGSLLNVDYTKGDFKDPNEPLLNENQVNSFYPTVGAGVFMYGDDWYTGISVPNFLTNGIYNDEVATLVADKIQFNAVAGYVFDFGDDLKFKPALLVNYLQGAPVTFNVSANFLLFQSLTLGASYRVNNAVSGLAGFQISNNLFVGYAYDYSTNGYGEYNNGSHEIILKFYLGKGRKSVKSTRESSTKPAKGAPKQIDTPRFF